MFTLPQLPFEKNALEPYISAETIEYHYWKHHQTYVDNLNKLVAWTEFENKNLEEIIKLSNWWIFNNSAQVWNHTFYWNCLSPNSSKSPTWKIAKLINENFWSFEKFKEEFSNKAISNFGSGWTWLAQKENWSLEIINTSNANNLLTTNDIPLLVIDIWEHAYYIDVRNARAKYVENFWNLVNWEFVDANLE
jgi:Fe-Mn family superoxide dismutase